MSWIRWINQQIDPIFQPQCSSCYDVYVQAAIDDPDDKSIETIQIDGVDLVIIRSNRSTYLIFLDESIECSSDDHDDRA